MSVQGQFSEVTPLLHLGPRNSTQASLTKSFIQTARRCGSEVKSAYRSNRGPEFESHLALADDLSDQ